ncbi:hypothetical protein LDO26_08870 [Luteimonas sp. BDR2-5]|uniref:hypothetical protein n=1 Tax=Proluteimonas luteida TaxID=2878685 RepID=UPI001E60BADB|nr:hypothetical protein [Luteimonas sp. BDR2-5]MCD9028320.1 hypothetical protein [Luteimonas sp. BDR2-5]
MNGASMALLLAGVLCAFPACAADAPGFDDRSAMRLPESVTEVRMLAFTFPAPSPAMQAMLADPAAWAPPVGVDEVGADVERKAFRIRFDADGWLESSALNWSGDAGWTLWLRWSRIGTAPPSRVEAVLAPPQVPGGDAIVLGQGDVLYPDPLAQVTDLATRHPVDGLEHLLRTRRFDAEGRAERTDSETRREDGSVARDVFEVAARDPRGHAIRGRQLLGDQWFDLSIRRIGGDAGGDLPARVLTRFTRAGDCGEDAPVARAELTLYEYRSR